MEGQSGPTEKFEVGKSFRDSTTHKRQVTFTYIL
jgi:hypothetical protein